MLVLGKSLKMDLTSIFEMLAWATTQPTLVGDFVPFFYMHKPTSDLNSNESLEHE